MSEGTSRRIGIDLGGTGIKAGAITAAGEVLGEASVDTGAGDGAAAVLDRMAGLARELGGSGAVGVGVGVAGLVDPHAGLIIESPNLSSMSGVDLRSELAQRLDLGPESIFIGNDANAAALGEQWLGAAQNEENVLFVTLGTGIGGGLVFGGRLFHGQAFASEFGHVVIERDGEACPCGSHGCVERYASATAASARARVLGLPPEAPGDLPVLAQRAREGSPAESQLLFKIGRDLGRALGIVVTLLDVRCFVMGGGFSGAFDTMEVGIRAGIEERSFIARREQVKLMLATLGARAGWIGAARLALP